MRSVSLVSVVILLLIASLLMACAAQNEQAKSQQTPERNQSVDTISTYVYQCGEELEFVAYVNTDTAWLFLPGRTVQLKQTPTATGAKYLGEGVVFWSDGEYGWFRGNEGAFDRCVNNRKRAIWEHAKLRGVDYRAVGNEPGWHVELWPDRILYVGDYGSVQYSFDRPEPLIDQQGATAVYETAADGVSFKMKIESGKCLDTMSGEEFSSEVTIWLGGRELRGCGNPLH